MSRPVGARFANGSRTLELTPTVPSPLTVRAQLHALHGEVR